jgi:zinc protease
MKFFSKITILALLALAAACTPKAGEKASVSTGKAPRIPLPTGDVRKAAPKAGDAPTIQIGKAETFTLDNGLQVIVVENHKLPKVSFRVFVDNSPVLEKDAAGYVDMMGELLSKGTKTRSKPQLDEEVDFIGASLSTDAHGVTANCLSKHSERVLDLMSDVLLNPVFSAEEFEKAKRRSESGLASNKDDASAIASNVGARLRYGSSHPYGEFMTEETLNKITLEQVRSHYDTYFKPNISYLVITGDISRSKAEQYAKKYFGKWQRGDVKGNNYIMPRAPEKTQVDFVNKTGAVQSVINITYPVELMPGTQEAIKARVANAILGGYFNSRVNANLREGHGWTYGARTNLRPDELVGQFTAFASVRNAVTDSSVVEFLKEMERMRTEKVPTQELSVVKNVLTGQFSQSLEEPGTVAEFALTTARFKLPANYYEQYLTVLQSVTAEEVLQIAKKYFRPDRAHILVVGNRDEVAERLKPLATDGKVNFLDIYGQPVKMVNTNLPPGMTGDKVIEDYLNAIGGTAKISALRDVQTTLGMKSRGMEITVKQIQKDGSKLVQEMLMNGQSMGKTTYDGTKAVQTGMGGASRNLEGEQLAELKEQALPIKEAAYKSMGYQLTLKSVEEVEGKSAYVVEVSRPNGQKSTEYYEVSTSLKLREVSTTAGPDGTSTTVTNDFSDYREVGGVKFPHTSMTTGVFPTPMKAVVSDLKVNAGVDDALFLIK